MKIQTLALATSLLFSIVAIAPTSILAAKPDKGGSGKKAEKAFQKAQRKEDKLYLKEQKKMGKAQSKEEKILEKESRKDERSPDHKNPGVG